MKFVAKFMTILPFLILVSSLSLVVGFLLMQELYLAGSWLMTSMMTSLAIVYIQRWKDAEDRARAERLANQHLTDVITRHIIEENKKK